VQQRADDIFLVFSAFVREGCGQQGMVQPVDSEARELLSARDLGGRKGVLGCIYVHAVRLDSPTSP
jgi:hypothetical protein